MIYMPFPASTPLQVQGTRKQCPDARITRGNTGNSLRPVRIGSDTQTMPNDTHRARSRTGASKNRAFLIQSATAASFLFVTLRQSKTTYSMKPLFIAGPCVIESAELLERVACELVRIKAATKAEIYFKASFDKANRTSIHSFRGPGLERGLKMLSAIKSKYGLPLLTDIHESYQAEAAGEVVDVLQIPAFLCRQTDLLVAAARTGRAVNIKKAQFLSGEDMKYPVEKCREAGAVEVWLTERGNVFGYNNLVVDFRNLPIMAPLADRVIMDCTHSVQRPGAAGGKTGGDRRFVPAMALAAKAFGAAGYFFETHPDPDHALSDGPNMLPLDEMGEMIEKLIN